MIWQDIDNGEWVETISRKKKLKQRKAQVQKEPTSSEIIAANSAAHLNNFNENNKSYRSTRRNFSANGGSKSKTVRLFSNHACTKDKG